MVYVVYERNDPDDPPQIVARYDSVKDEWSGEKVAQVGFFLRRRFEGQGFKLPKDHAQLLETISGTRLWAALEA